MKADRLVGGSRPNHHALLVGVTEYPTFGAKFKLAGPAHDTVLLGEVLNTRFSFEAERVRVLSEEAGRHEAARLPTRANIVRELTSLVDSVAKGDEVVIFFAGHGSQQPERVAGSEVDGLDEIFLPRDVGKWDSARGSVTNAIIDDEIAGWLQALTSKGAHVWAIFDCCHSGDLSRGVNERQRFVEPADPEGLGIPMEIRQLGRREGAVEHSAREAALDFAVLENAAIVYACQSHERAIEIPFESGDGEQYHGLLSYSLVSVLSKARGPLTYRQLSREIYREYVASGRSGGPTPLVEGEDIDRVVMGAGTIEPPQIRIGLDPRDELRRRLTIDAGQLHGITPGTILAVHAARSGETKKEMLGYVRVTVLGVASSVVESCEYEGMRRRLSSRLAGGVCHVVETDFGDLKVPVWISTVSSNGEPLPDESRQLIVEALDTATASSAAMATVTSVPDVRTWKIHVGDGAVFLIPAEESGGRPSLSTKRQSATFGPFPLDASLSANLSIALSRIARAENLLRLASAGWAAGSDESGLPKLQVEQEIHRRGGVRDGGQDLPLMNPGDVLDMRVRNTGNVDFDVTVLYVNSHVGIKPLYPVRNSYNRIRPGQVRRLPLAEFTNGPFGRNHFVVIAVLAEGPTVDFAWLGQESLPKHRSHRTPIDGLLEQAVFAEGGVRSARSNASCMFCIIPVDVTPGGEAR
ncbi:caspase family protein [Maioricimonas sp. JC845]|uniref:caspase family protein n=1 Tax=Maioricimonas sp. JC845 TaxID=3232138 RepID=UPI0034592436